MAKTKVHGEYLDPSVISGQTQVTAVGADSVLILDATDNSLKKALLSDVIETIDGGAPTFTTATISGSNPVLNIARTSNYTYKIGSLANDTFAIQSNETTDASYVSLIEIDSFAHQGSSPAIKVDSSGNVGIGGSPGAKLDVNTGTVNTLAHFHSTDDNAFIELKDDDTTGYIGVQNDYVYVGGAPSTNTQNLVIHKTSGNVGIRWTAPTARLGILQNGSTTPGMNITDGATADFRVFAGYVSGTTRIGTSAGHLAIDTAGTERSRISSSGKASWSAGGIGAVATQDRDFTFYTEGSTNGIDIRSNDYRNVLLGAGASSGSGMDSGFIGLYKDGNSKIGINASGNSFILADSGSIPNSTSTNLFIQDTTALAAGVGGSIVFSGIYTGSTQLNNGPYIKAFKTNATDGDYGFGLRFAIRENNSTQKTGMEINSSGYVSEPLQPYIRCAGNSASMAANQGTTADYSNWANQVQRGITRSGATFTVPVTGEYLVTYSFYNWINNSGPNVTHAVYLQKNGSTVQETVAEYDFENDAFSYMDNQLQNSLILNMAAGDTFKFATYADIYGGSTHTNMSAYLLG